MNAKMILSTIVSFGIVALSSLPASARDAVLRANFRDSTINLRATPSINAPLRGIGLPGDRVTILVERRIANNKLWYYVRFRESGAEGWIDGTYVQPVVTPSPTPRSQGGTIDSPPYTDDSRYIIGPYEVRVFFEGGQAYVNVFNSRTKRMRLNSVPVEVRESPDGTTYEGRSIVLFIGRNGRNTIMFD
ncbi:MAG: SH3 domain-containing protein [Leptolyngbya sp. Prado105]|jgi:hypothetical protein|nr:SH3 domain-containing protein [Leptolyngbya sp. Prado105]